MKHAIGLPASGLFTSRALTRAVGACFDSRVLRGAALASALALGAVTSAQAATYFVTNTNRSGSGSLESALSQAAASWESDTIVFDSMVTGTIDLADTEWRNFNGGLTMTGSSPNAVTVRGMGIYSKDDYSGEGFTFEGLTLRESGLNGMRSDHTGARVIIRNCNLAASWFSVSSAVVEDSRLNDVGLNTMSPDYDGGGRLTLLNSSAVQSDIGGAQVEIVNSVVTGSSDHGVTLPGTFYFPSRARLVVRNSVIAGSRRAGIQVVDPGASVDISSSVIADNGLDGIVFETAEGYYPESLSTRFNLVVSGSTISGNGGRAIRVRSGDFAHYGYPVHPAAASVLQIDNSTLVGNGGGVEVILAEGGHLSSDSRITRTTIAGSSAERGGGINVVRDVDAAQVGIVSSLILDSTLIAKNTARVAGPDLFTDVSGFTFKADYSLIQNPAGAPITSTVAGSNITGQDPKLLRLANLGGTTSVRALGAGSPALNKGNPSSANVPATDQRGVGFPRVAGGRIDIGAFEQQSVDVAPVVLRSLPDVTGNGTPELAALVQSIPTGATTVRVRDALTGAAHWQVTLPGAGEAIDLETLGDVNGNGKRDIAVLRTAPASVAIRDGLTGAAVKTIALTSGFFPKALATLTDVNGNGKPEVAVLGTKAGKSVVELRDSQTGALIKSTTFNSPGTPRDIVALRQEAGNASSAALLGVLMDVRDPTQSDSLEIRNALTGALVTRGNVGAGAESMEAVVMPDSNGNSGNEFAVLKSSGEVRVFDLPGFAPMTTMQFIAGDAALHLTAVPDTNGSGVTELAVMSRHQADGALKAEVRDAATGVLIKTMDYSAQYRADDLVSVPDINNNGVAELSQVGPNSSGVVRATQRDVATGVLSSRVNLVP